MEFNVSNIPINTLYRFDVNKYVWSTLLTETRGSGHMLGESYRVTEVYEITDEGYMKLIASGKLIHHKDIPNYGRGFAIYDYDKEETINFKVAIRLQKLTLNDLYELREAIAKNYKKANQ